MPRKRGQCRPAAPTRSLVRDRGLKVRDELSQSVRACRSAVSGGCISTRRGSCGCRPSVILRAAANSRSAAPLAASRRDALPNRRHASQRAANPAAQPRRARSPPRWRRITPRQPAAASPAPQPHRRRSPPVGAVCTACVPANERREDHARRPDPESPSLRACEEVRRVMLPRPRELRVTKGVLI